MGWIPVRLRSMDSGEDCERLRALDNPRDGWVDRHFNRHIARPLTVLLVRIAVTPNQITVASALIGMAAGLVIAQGGYWPPVLGALLLQVSAIFDDIDGSLARLTGNSSAWGEWLDVVGDTLTQLSVFAGIAVAVSREAGPAALEVAGALLLSGAVLSFALVTWLEKRVFPQLPPTPWRRRIQRYVEVLSGRDSSVLVMAAALIGRLDWFLWGAAFGAHLFWISLLGLWRFALAEANHQPTGQETARLGRAGKGE